jgi:protein-disulfide isomerase
VAAQAARCANEQGKFWEMYDKLFINQSNLKVVALKKLRPAVEFRPDQVCQLSG